MKLWYILCELNLTHMYFYRTVCFLFSTELRVTNPLLKEEKEIYINFLTKKE